MSPTKDDDDDDDDTNASKKVYEQYERLKVRFSTLYDENLGPNDPKEINTLLFVNGKQADAKSPSAFEKQFYWNCTVQFAVMFSKFWIQKSGKKECGLSVKCIQIAVLEQPEKKQNMLEQFQQSIFASSNSVSKKADSGDDSEESENDSDEKSEKVPEKDLKKDQKDTKKDTKKEQKKEAKKEKSESEQEEDDSDKSDSEESEKDANSDESDDSDSDKSDSESDEESEEEVKVEKKSAKVTVKGKGADNSKKKNK
jgi:hypothetical protein